MAEEKEKEIRLSGTYTSVAIPPPSKQRLLDIMIEITMMVHSHPHFKNKDANFIGDYIRDQLNKSGFNVKPVGMSHAVLFQ